MSATYYAPGARLTYSNTGSAIVAGDVIVLASGTTGMLAIALVAIAATSGTGEVAIGGHDERIWILPKSTGEAFTVGQLVYWDGTNLGGTSTTTSTRAGRIAEAAASAATTAKLILNQA